MKSFIKKYFPLAASLGRRLKRRMLWKKLEHKKKHSVITKEKIKSDLLSAGIKRGDLLMVHSSMSSIGYLENGPAGFVDACLEVLGKEGTLVMPAFAHNTFSKIYLDTDPVFDILKSPSKAGAITEELRKRANSLRSFHPTDAVTAHGPLAEYLVKDHFGQITPYNNMSPYFRIAEKKGKILNIGIPLSISCTNLHTLEDAVDFKYPIYHSRIYEVRMVDETGTQKRMKTRVHDPVYSEKRKAEKLVPLFEREGILILCMIGEAPSTLIDAAGLLEVMIRNYREKGITMYTPEGDKPGA